MEMNEELKKECMEICEHYKIEINFNDKNWENEFIENLDFPTISTFENLSEDFIDYFQNEVHWDNISAYQKLSENFIEKFQDRVNWHYIYNFQKLSRKFVEKYRGRFSEFIWNLKTDEEKENDIKNAGYDILEDEKGKYIFSYKAIGLDNRLLGIDKPYYGLDYYPEKYEYVVGKIYKHNCNCGIYREDALGLSAWDLQTSISFGKLYNDFKLIVVKIYIDDIGMISKWNKNKIICFQFEVIEDLGVYKNGNE